LIATAVPDTKWRRVFAGLWEIAHGDGSLALKAARLLMSYAVAMPVQDLAGTDESF
jgi:hypothetical protein